MKSLGATPISLTISSVEDGSKLFSGRKRRNNSAHDLTERNLLGRERRSAVSTMNEQTVADHWRRAMEAKEASKPKPKPAQRRTFAHIRDYRVAGR